MLRISERLSGFLDASRWIAAAAVVTDHARILIFAQFDPASSGLLTRVFYFATGFGRIAVVIFFALSGFLVGGEVLSQVSSGRFSWRQYAIRRFSRIYPVYVLALLLGAALDWVGLHHFNTLGIYSGGVAFPGLNFSVSDRFNGAVLAQNLLFLQGNTCEVFGSNQPLWSVAYEAWYYLLFPLLLWPVLTRDARPLLRVCALAAAGGAMVFIRGDILLYFLVWLIGLLPHLMAGRPRVPEAGSLCALAVAISVARLGLVPGFGGFNSEVVIGLTFALCISAFSRPDAKPLHGARTARFLASFSYSLYATHWPLLLLIVSLTQALFRFGLRQSPTAGASALWLLLVAVCYGASLGIATMTEFKTLSIRRRLSGLVGATHPDPGPAR